MRSHLPAFLRQLELRRAAPRTVRSYERVVLAFASFCGSDEPTAGNVEAFLSRPRFDGRQRAPRGHNHELGALRAFFSFGVAKLDWQTDPTQGIDLAREPPHDPVVLSVGEVRRVFSAAAEQSCPLQRARNLALFAVLATTGLRVHELVRISLDQLDPIGGTLYAVKGKGGTLHDQVLNAEAVRLLERWVELRRGCAAAGEHALFIGVRTGRRLSIRAVQHLVHEFGKQAGIARNVSPHSFRHTVATIALAQGADIVVVASILRHSKIETTRRYIRLVDTQRRAAVDRLGVVIPRELLGAAPLPALVSMPPANTAEESLRATSESPVIPASDSSCIQGCLDAASAADLTCCAHAPRARAPGASKRGVTPEEGGSMGVQKARSSGLGRSWLFWSVLSALTACAEAQPPFRWSLPVQTVRAHDGEPDSQTHDNLSITVRPVTSENVRQFPQVNPLFSVTTMQGGQPSTSSFRANIVPFPAFRVTIANHTGHVVRFTRSIFRLTDQGGRRFEPFATTEEFISWNEADFSNAMASDAQIRRTIRTSVGALNLLTRNTELLNGDVWEGWLVFNTTRTSDFQEFMATIERFTLRLAELPIEVNQAGEVSRTTEFTFRFNKSQFLQWVTCPAGVTPSFDACTPEARPPSGASGGEASAGPAGTQPAGGPGEPSSPPAVSPVRPSPPGRTFVLAGALTGGIPYGISVLSGLVIIPIAAGGGFGSEAAGGAALLLPVLGPFITIPLFRASGGAAAVLALDGLVQAGGAGMFVAGMVMNSRAAANPPSRGGFVASWAVAPWSQTNATGLAFHALTF